MGLFSKKKTELMDCTSLEEFFRQIDSATLMDKTNRWLINLRYKRCEGVFLYDPRKGTKEWVYEHRYRLVTHGSWIWMSFDQKVPKAVKKSSKPDGITAMKILSERAVEQGGDIGYYMILMGLIYEFGMAEGIAPDEREAKKYYYLAEQTGSKVLPLINYLRDKNYTNYTAFKDDAEMLFFNILPISLNTAMERDPKVKEFIGGFEQKDLIWLKKYGTIGVAHLGWLGYPYSRTIVTVLMSDKDQWFGEETGFFSKSLFGEFFLDNDMRTSNRIVITSEAAAGDVCAQAACLSAGWSY